MKIGNDLEDADRLRAQETARRADDQARQASLAQGLQPVANQATRTPTPIQFSHSVPGQDGYQFYTQETNGSPQMIAIKQADGQTANRAWLYTDSDGDKKITAADKATLIQDPSKQKQYFEAAQQYDRSIASKNDPTDATSKKEEGFTTYTTNNGTKIASQAKHPDYLHVAGKDGKYTTYKKGSPEGKEWFDTVDSYNQAKQAAETTSSTGATEASRTRENPLSLEQRIQRAKSLEFGKELIDEGRKQLGDLASTASGLFKAIPAEAMGAITALAATQRSDTAETTSPEDKLNNMFAQYGGDVTAALIKDHVVPEKAKEIEAAKAELAQLDPSDTAKTREQGRDIQEQELIQEYLQGVVRDAAIPADKNGQHNFRNDLERLRRLEIRFEAAKAKEETSTVNGPSYNAYTDDELKPSLERNIAFARNYIDQMTDRDSPSQLDRQIMHSLVHGMINSVSTRQAKLDDNKRLADELGNL